MPRSIVLGNGDILIGLDAFAQVRDFYFPYIGAENQMGPDDVHKIGVWKDGMFSWLDDGTWTISINCAQETFASNIEATHERLQLKLEFQDLVYNEKNILLRQVTVHNLGGQREHIRLFFNQQFELYQSHKGDTAYFDPRDRTIVHYKGRRICLINGKTGEGKQFNDYSIGSFQTKGKEGTYKDAEDGVLGKNPIEHGKVDSVIGFSLDIEAQKNTTVYYWITVAKLLEEAKSLNEYVDAKTPEHLIKSTKDFWHAWVNRHKFDFYDLSTNVISLFKKSLFYIRAHADNAGAIIASSDSDMLQYGVDTYGYMWPRDGAMGAIALDRVGDQNIAKKFFEFCSAVVTRQGYFMHKYRSDKSLGSSWHPWIRDGKEILPIQEDETALIIYALWQHYQLTKDLEFIESVYNNLIKRTADFMVNYRSKKTLLPKPTYDIWEEKYGSSTFTACAVHGALNAAANFAKLLGKTDEEQRYRGAAIEIQKAILEFLYDSKTGLFHKMLNEKEDSIIYDKTLDASSIYGVFKFGILGVHDKRLKKGVERMEEMLCCKTAVGGLPRYEDDRYYRVSFDSPPNPWFVTTLWLAQYYIAKAQNEADLQKAKEWLDWVVKYATPSGILSEQLDPYSGAQLSASPLTWSHSEYVITVIQYLEKLDELGICRTCNPLKFDFVLQT